MGAVKSGADRLGRFARRWRLDRNPLRRATDRVETALLAVLVTAFLVGAPFAALAAGTWVHGMAERTQLSQQASRSQVQAVVLTVASQPLVGGSLTDQAQARWQAPDGRVVTGQVPVPGGTAAGARLTVWTDKAGAVTTAPLADAAVAGQTGFAQALGALLTAGVLTLTVTMARRAIDKRRMAAWDADWHATGPRWTTRGPRPS